MLARVSIESACSLATETQCVRDSEKGLRVVRGTPQVEEGEGAQTLLPLLHIHVSSRFFR
jgi:hypothetical protein